MKKLIIYAVSLSFILFFYIGCGNDSEPNSTYKLSTVLKDIAYTESKSIVSKLSQSSSGLGIEAFYFDDLDVVGYSYRPNSNIQMNGGWGGYGHGYADNTWSYWIIQNGVTDTILKSGEQLEISDYHVEPEDNYIEDAGAFSLDILEVYIYYTGIIYNGAYYGPFANTTSLVYNNDLQVWEEKPLLYKYPEYNDYPQNLGSSTNNILHTATNILFVRDDWFNEPVYMNVNRTLMDGVTVEIFGESKPLTEFQINIIKNWALHCTYRRFIYSVLVVPFNQWHGPLILNFKDHGNTATRIIENNEIVDRVLYVNDTQLSIKLDLSHTIQAEPAIDTGSIYNSYRYTYTTDTNGVPLGLSIELTTTKSETTTK